MTTSGGRRDLDGLRSGLLAWCAEHRPVVAEHGIEDLSHPSEGLSNETVVVRCRPRADGSPGPRLVVRLPPQLASFPDVDLALQARVQNAVADAGVPTAAPAVVEEDPRWLGVPFIVMPYVDGTIPGPASLFDPWLTGAGEQQRRDAQREMVGVLAGIQSIDWRAAGLGELLIGPADGGNGTLSDQLGWWTGYLRWAMAGESMPRIEGILEWCERHRPPYDAPPSLVWGDPRLGNLVVDDARRTRAVLDWELATIGPAEMDLGWYLGLERVLHELVGKEPLPGFAPTDEVVHDYEAAIGRPVEDLAWHMVFAVLRSISINVRQAAIAAEAGVTYLIPAGEANPLVAVVEGWIEAYPRVPGA